VTFSPDGAAGAAEEPAEEPVEAAGAELGAQAAKIRGPAAAAAICKKVRRDSLDGWLCILFLLTSKRKGKN